jgi:glycosyltransferase involved in cell wall biosynthesis
MISALEVWALAGQGGAPSLYKTLEGFGRRGHHIDFVSATVGANHQYGAPPQIPPDIPGVDFHLVHLPSLTHEGTRGPEIVAKADQKLRFALLFPLLAARRARKLLATHSYDVLYGYEVHGVLAQRLVRGKSRLPLVARFQGTVMQPYLGRPLSLLRKYEEVMALRTKAALYVMTDDGTQGNIVLRRLNPASQGKVRFWRNGLDIGLVRPPTEEEVIGARKRLALAPDELVLVTAARLARWKRIDRAIDAVALLRARGLKVRLLIVGDGEERANLEAQSRALGLEQAVTFVGGVAQSEVQGYLWAADVFLSLNELSNVGNPLLEAMLTERCILTLDEGDTRELIADGNTGALLKSGEPAVIAEALAGLADDAAKRQRLAENALELAQRSFWDWRQRIDAEVDEVEALVYGPDLAHD